MKQPERNGIQFEATGNLDQWPKNLPGKPTQAAVFGMSHPTKGRICEILWTGKFPDLNPAMYWAAKKEIEAVRKGKWEIASRVLWQHDLTPEHAVETVRKEMDKQIDQLLEQRRRGEGLELGPGPMQPVDHDKVLGHYVEIDTGDEDEDFGFWIMPDKREEGQES